MGLSFWRCIAPCIDCFKRGGAAEEFRRTHSSRKVDVDRDAGALLEGPASGTRVFYLPSHQKRNTQGHLVRFSVTKLKEQNAKIKNRILQLDIHRRCVSVLTSHKKKVKVSYELSEIELIERLSLMDNCQLNISVKFHTAFYRPRTYKYIFPSTMQRDWFANLCQCLSSRMIGKDLSSSNVAPPGLNSVTVFIGTWNMGAAVPPPSLDSFIPCEACDLYAIGTQESCASDVWSNCLVQHLGKEYVRVAHHEMGSIFLHLFVRKSLSPMIRDVETFHEATGIGGVGTNKGAVAVALSVGDTRLCFVVAHLAARAVRVLQRNQNVKEIFDHVHFGGIQADIAAQYNVFFFGDLNYRIDIARDKTLELIAQRDWETLLREGDQLTKEQAKENVFSGFTEGAIEFPPSYKYVHYSNTAPEKPFRKYTRKKLQTPSWCDRILWRPLPSTLVEQCPVVVRYRPVSQQERRRSSLGSMSRDSKRALGLGMRTRVLSDSLGTHDHVAEGADWSHSAVERAGVLCNTSPLPCDEQAGDSPSSTLPSLADGPPHTRDSLCSTGIPEDVEVGGSWPAGLSSAAACSERSSSTRTRPSSSRGGGDGSFACTSADGSDPVTGLSASVASNATSALSDPHDDDLGRLSMLGSDARRLGEWRERPLDDSDTPGAFDRCWLPYHVADEIQTSDHSPVYGMFRVSMAEAPPIRQQYAQCHIHFAELKITDLRAYDVGYETWMARKNDGVEIPPKQIKAKVKVAIHLPFIADKRVVFKTVRKDQTLNPVWEESKLPRVGPFLAQPQFLASQDIILRVLDRSGLAGCTAISLKGADERPLRFSCPISRRGRPAGTVSGVVHIRRDHAAPQLAGSVVRRMLQSTFKSTTNMSNLRNYSFRRGDSLLTQGAMTRSDSVVAGPVCYIAPVKKKSPATSSSEPENLSRDQKPANVSGPIPVPPPPKQRYPPVPEEASLSLSSAANLTPPSATPPAEGAGVLSHKGVGPSASKRVPTADVAPSDVQPALDDNDSSSSSSSSARGTQGGASTRKDGKVGAAAKESTFLRTASGGIMGPPPEGIDRVATTRNKDNATEVYEISGFAELNKYKKQFVAQHLRME